MANEPLCFDFHGRLLLVIEARAIRYRPVLALLARTFSAFRAPRPALGGPSLTVVLGPFEPDLKNRHLVDGAFHVAAGSVFRRYRHKLARWKFEVDGLEDAATRVRIEGNAFSYLVFPYESIHQMILFKLGREGLVFLHALGVARDGRAGLIIGRSGVGKSLLGGKFLRDGYRLLGDDTVFLDGSGAVYGFPLPLGLRSIGASLRDYGVRMTLADRALFLLTRIIKAATLGHIGLLFKLSAARLGNRLAMSARLEYAVFALPSASFSLAAETDSGRFLDRVASCGSFETVLLDKLLEAYLYIFPESRLKDLPEEQRGICASAFASPSLFQAGIPGVLRESVYADLRRALPHG